MTRVKISLYIYFVPVKPEAPLYQVQPTGMWLFVIWVTGVSNFVRGQGYKNNLNLDLVMTKHTPENFEYM